MWFMHSLCVVFGTVTSRSLTFCNNLKLVCIVAQVAKQLLLLKMARVTRGHAITAIIFGVIEVLMGIAIIVASFVAASKVSNALYSPYWAGFVVGSSFCNFFDSQSYFPPKIFVTNLYFICSQLLLRFKFLFSKLSCIFEQNLTGKTFHRISDG